MQTADFSASDQVTEEFVSKNGGTVNVVVAGLNSDDEKLFFGSHVDTATGLITSNKDDIVPYVMTIYSLPTASGKVNLYKIPKVKFTNKGANGTTKTTSGATFNTVDLEGKYSPTLSTGDEMYVIKGVDPNTTEGGELIEQWFNSATGGLS